MLNTVSRVVDRDVIFGNINLVFKKTLKYFWICTSYAFLKNLLHIKTLQIYHVLIRGEEL